MSKGEFKSVEGAKARELLEAFKDKLKRELELFTRLKENFIHHKTESKKKLDNAEMKIRELVF